MTSHAAQPLARAILCAAVLGFQLLATPAPVWAQAVGEGALERSVVYIPILSETGANAGHGAGTIVVIDEGKLLVLTAYHNIQGHVAMGRRQVEMVFYGQRARLTGEIVEDWIDTDLDLALLRVTSPNIPPQATAMEPGESSGLAPRSEVTIVGHRLGGGFEKWIVDRGWIVQPIGPELKFSSKLVDRGFSGGPVFDQNGNLVGIITRVEGGMGVAKSIEVVSAFMRVAGYAPPKTIDLDCETGPTKLFEMYKGDRDPVDQMLLLLKVTSEVGCVGHSYSRLIQEPSDTYAVTPKRRFEDGAGRACVELQTLLRMRTEVPGQPSLQERNQIWCQRGEFDWEPID